MTLKIPQDASKPVGDAVDKDRNLLSVSKLTFFNSSSDENPLLPNMKKGRAAAKKDDDKDYHPPKQTCPLDDEAPENFFDNNSKEIAVETEKGQRTVSVKSDLYLSDSLCSGNERQRNRNKRRKAFQKVYHQKRS